MLKNTEDNLLTRCEKMRAVTLCYCLKGNKVLFAVKKRGFGTGKLNGYGGKVQDEAIEQAAVRELQEEAGITASETDLEKVAEIDFSFPEIPPEKKWDQTVHVFLLRKWDGDPIESDEMKPAWHDLKKPLPFDQMWAADKHWLEAALRGEKFKAAVKFGKEGAVVLGFEMTPVKTFD
jgi:8-oxo-dGTP pyrophosphatase MutT (NUDIX family)